MGEVDSPAPVTDLVREPEVRIDQPPASDHQTRRISRVDNRVEIDETLRAGQSTDLSRRGRFGYTIVGLGLVLYMVFQTALAITYGTNIYAFSYYAVDYSQGFVRRGLAGEILRLFPADLYFTNLLILRWLVPALYIVGLMAVAWTVAIKFGRSERRLMLALLITVLPFGFARAVMKPETDLLGAAALAAFAVVLTLAAKGRATAILLASAAYGLTTAVLTLIHEAIPLLLSVGAIVAIVVLQVHRSLKIQRLSALLAVAPALVVALTIGLLGRRDESSQCTRLPHRAFDLPIKLPGQPIRSGQNYVDYHDWVCRHIITNYGKNPADAFRELVSLGPTPLIMSTIVGIGVFAVTIFFISSISGVSFRQFSDVLRGRLSWVVVAALLILPVFATSVDWTRWWVVISFDFGIVYLLYANSQPQSAQPPTGRTRTLFAVGVVMLALLPLGTTPHVGVMERLGSSHAE